MIRSAFKYLLIVGIFCAVAGLSAFLTLSFFIRSEDTVIVPDLTEKNAIEALEMLSDLNLNTKVAAMEFSAHIARHHVIHQDPGPGETIKINRDVSLIISKGSRTMKVPNLSGRQLDRARITLEETGLAAGHIAWAHDKDLPRGRIMTHIPGPENETEQGGTVDLLVSAGPRTRAFLMPDLRRRFLDEAILSIEKHHMTLESLKFIYDPSKTENTVTGQAPPTGYRVEEGEAVRLIINRAPGSQKADRAEKRVLFSHRLPPGFLKQRVRLEMNGFGTHFVLIDDLMEPGALIWTVVPENTQAAVFLYINGKLVESEVYN